MLQSASAKSAALFKTISFGNFSGSPGGSFDECNFQDDYSDDEMEHMNATEEGNLNEDVKNSILTTLLVAAGIEIVAGG